MAFTVAQVSDTHLGSGTGLFRPNFARMVAALSQSPPDATVLSGDMSADGAGDPADLKFAAQMCRALGPTHAVPGNHDVGDAAHRDPLQPVTDARLAEFRKYFGPDRWVLDRDGWRLLGLNSQVMGAHPEETAQIAFIENALETLEDRRLAVFLHKSVFIHDPAETDFAYWTVPAGARRALRPLLEHPALRLVASGHLHIRHAEQRGRVWYHWAPSVAFVVRPEDQPGLPGERICGALLHRFDTDGVTTTVLRPEWLEQPFIHEVTPDMTAPD